MTDAHDIRPDQSALVYRHHEQLYRLALLVAGDAEGAMALVERAYHDLPAGSTDTEAALIRALLRPEKWRRPWRRGPARYAAPRRALDWAHAEQLLDILAAMPTAARLVVGLHYLCGMSASEITGLLGGSIGPQSPEEMLARFRASAARALELIPADADDDALLLLDRSMDGLIDAKESRALRWSLIDRPELRALRDALIQVRDLLPRAIPAIFAATPPPELTQRLLDSFEEPRHAQHRLTRLRGGLVLGVLALVAAIVVLPSLLARGDRPTAMAPQTPGEIVEAAIHRFDRAPVQQGVLHEQYRVELDDQPAYMIERWYDYAAPHRLHTTVKSEQDKSEPLMEVSSDGRSLVQYRFGPDTLPFGQRSIDVRVSQGEAQKLLTLLRGEPSAWFFSRGAIDQVDLGPLYLAQARAADTSFLGQTSFLGRPAYLLSYHSDRLPSVPWRRSAGQASRVLLTIDAQTYALLDIAILADGAAESTAKHLLQALVLDVSERVPDGGFTLPPTPEVVERTDLLSARVPNIPDTQGVSLEDLLRRASKQLLAPQQLPDANMRGQALMFDPNDADGVLLLYEGEFQSVMLLPRSMFRDLPPQESEEQSAGSFRYRILRSPDVLSNTMAEVYRPETPNDTTMVLLVDAYATPQERMATLKQLIASLTPITEQTLPVLRPNFERSEMAGGQG